MLTKLSLRNARRSIKDYIVYILTMTLISSLMFAFNGMIFSNSIQAVLNEIESLIVFIGLASFFVVLIVVWLTRYIIQFMLEKRSKEFGTYMLIGMHKKQILKVFKKEHIILAICTFVLGILPGYLIQLALTNLFFSIFNTQYFYSVDIHVFNYLLTLSYYIIAYFLALFRLSKKFKKLQIYDLLYMENRNENIKTKSSVIKNILFFISLGYIIFFHFYVFLGYATAATIWLLLLVLIFSIYGLFIGLSSYVVRYIQKKNNYVNTKANLFILRQLVSKIKTMRFTMGSLTILFIVTMLSWTTVLMFSDYQRKIIDINIMPIDILYYSETINDDFMKKINIIEQHAQIKQWHTYHIYRTDSDTLNQYLYTHVEGALPEYGSYFNFDTIMLLTDYNQLRIMSGFEEVQLTNTSYIIQGKDRLEETFITFGQTHDVVINDNTLTYQTTETIPFSQSGMNGADYLLIVPDQYQNYLLPYFSILAANVESDTLYDLEQALFKLNSIYLDYDYFEEEPDLDFGYGSDRIIVNSGPILVREPMILELDSVLTGLSFTLGYIGIVFLATAMSILAIQQLSDASKFKYRYTILKNLGMNQKERNAVVIKQLAVYYLCPVITAILISMFTGMYTSHYFVFYTGLNVISFQYYLMALSIFIVLFLIYFLVTYISFTRAIEKP